MKIAHRFLALVWRILPESFRWWLQWVLNPKVVVGVSGILINERDEVLLLKHRFHPENPWGFPGGWVKRGESVDQAWIREVREETGLSVVVEGTVIQETSSLTLEFILWGRIVGGNLLLDNLEILDAQYFRLDALPDGLHADHHAAVHMVFDHCTAQMPLIRNRALKDMPFP